MRFRGYKLYRHSNVVMIKTLYSLKYPFDYKILFLDNLIACLAIDMSREENGYVETFARTSFYRL